MGERAPMPWFGEWEAKGLIEGMAGLSLMDSGAVNGYPNRGRAVSVCGECGQVGSITING
jgi:hypothetical protein